MGWMLLKFVEAKTKAKGMELGGKFLQSEDFEFIRKNICSLQYEK